ncbi:MAG: pentapeptide repeat-containing protein [Tolumonas sp.]|nr:pentapeptide repeat-containing protein [Tolumonas sp.]
MPDPFFILNSPFKTIENESEFFELLQNSRHLCDILYKPAEIVNKKIKNTKFNNISFSKKTITDTDINNCEFTDCLFIGTDFIKVNFSNCKFIRCNFYKSNFEQVYAKPSQFSLAITDKKYSNIAVHLYNQLRNNYRDDSQRKYKSEAEYQFEVWDARQYLYELKSNKKSLFLHAPILIKKYLHKILFGYGYRTRNLIATTVTIISILTLILYSFPQLFFTESIKPSVVQSIYYTITTMATLGASGFPNPTLSGEILIICNVLMGISLLSVTVNSIFKQVIR